MPQLLPVVVIDNDPDDLFFTSRRITAGGCANPLLVFSDPTQAIRHFEAQQFHPGPAAAIVFCDIRMPVMDGFEVLVRLRALKNFDPTPFYILSGSGLDADRRRACELGATDYLVKFPPKEVFAELIGAANGGVKPK